MTRLFSCDGVEVKLHDVESAFAGTPPLVDHAFSTLQREAFANMLQQQEQKQNADDDNEGATVTRKDSESFLQAAGSTAAAAIVPLLLPRSALMRECTLVRRILALSSSTAAVAESDSGEEEHGAPAVRTTTTTGSDDALDLRGLSCATVGALSIVSVWVLSRADAARDAIAPGKRSDGAAAAAAAATAPQSTATRSSRRRGQRHQFARLPLPSPSVENDDAAQDQEQQQQPNAPLTLADLNRRGPRRQEGVLVPPPDDPFPSRVSFDLESCFFAPVSSSAASRRFCLWLVHHHAWPEISRAHHLANFLGCAALSELLAQLTALHLRQVCASVPAGTIVASVALDAAKAPGSVDGSGAVVNAASASPAIAVESMQRRAEDSVNASIAASAGVAASAAAAGGTKSSGLAPTGGALLSAAALQALPNPVHGRPRGEVEREMYDAVMRLRGELLPAGARR